MDRRRQAMSNGKTQAEKDLALSLKQTANILGVNEERVRLLDGQGRLEAVPGGGEPSYDLASVYRMMGEDLLRSTTAIAAKKCPELVDDIEQLAMVQYARGMRTGAGTVAAPRLEMLKEALKKLEEAVEEDEKLRAEILAMKEDHKATLEKQLKKLDHLKELVEELQEKSRKSS
jgi:hypothetical protein